MITPEEMEQLARLSKLYLPSESLKLLAEEIERMVALADAITAAAPSETQEDEPRTPLDFSLLRADSVTPSLSRETLLQNAGGGENGYFAVRKKGGCG